METSEEKVTKLYLDTNIWLYYLNAKNKIVSDNKIGCVLDLFDLLIGSDEVYIPFSYFNMVELSSRLRDSLIHRRLMSEGFAIFELSKRSRGLILDDSETNELDDYLSAITSFSFVFPELTDFDGISAKNMEKLAELVGLGADIPDAIHVIYSLMYKCEYFVTNDGPLRDCINKAKQEFDSFDEIEVINCFECKDLLNKK